MGAEAWQSGGVKAERAARTVSVAMATVCRLGWRKQAAPGAAEGVELKDSDAVME